MSTLIIRELNDGITFTQPIKVDRNLSIRHVRPWVLLHGVLTTGDLQCRVLQGATELASVTINYVDINAAKTETYAHGYIRFDFDSLILNRAEGEQSTDYILEFSMINYVDDPANYLGIVREWDQKSSIVYGEVDGNGNACNDFIEPAGYQIFEYRS
jgi:hypothetical protein